MTVCLDGLRDATVTVGVMQLAASSCCSLGQLAAGHRPQTFRALCSGSHGRKRDDPASELKRGHRGDDDLATAPARLPYSGFLSCRKGAGQWLRSPLGRSVAFPAAPIPPIPLAVVAPCADARLLGWSPNSPLRGPPGLIRAASALHSRVSHCNEPGDAGDVEHEHDERSDAHAPELPVRAHEQAPRIDDGKDNCQRC